MEKVLCCDFLTENIIEAGRKGFSIIPSRIPDADTFYFVFQFRSKDYVENNSDVIISQRAIIYCPWCGTKLSDIVKEHNIEINTLANKFEYLVI